MNRLPYKLYIKQTESAEQNFEGDFSSAETVWKLHSDCRDEVNGSGKTVSLANGEAYVFAGIIYLNHCAGIIPEGSEVLVSRLELNPSILNDESEIKRLRQNGTVRLNGIVKGFEKSRLNVRLWL